MVRHTRAYVKFGRDHERKLPKPKREALFKGIKELMGFRRKDVKDVDDVTDGSGTIKTIAELSEEEFEELKRLFSRIFLEK